MTWQDRTWTLQDRDVTGYVKDMTKKWQVRDKARRGCRQNINDLSTPGSRLCTMSCHPVPLKHINKLTIELIRAQFLFPVMLGNPCSCCRSNDSISSSWDKQNNNLVIIGLTMAHTLPQEIVFSCIYYIIFMFLQQKCAGGDLLGILWKQQLDFQRVSVAHWLFSSRVEWFWKTRTQPVEPKLFYDPYPNFTF